MEERSLEPKFEKCGIPFDRQNGTAEGAEAAQAKLQEKEQLFLQLKEERLSKQGEASCCRPRMLE